MVIYDRRASTGFRHILKYAHLPRYSFFLFYWWGRGAWVLSLIKSNQFPIRINDDIMPFPRRRNRSVRVFETSNILGERSVSITSIPILH